MAEDKNKYVEATLGMITSEIELILNSDEIYDSYKGHVVICDEQIFAQQKQLTPKTIYLVVKFGNASFDFGQALLPITINAVSEQNALDICQRILFELATRYTQEEPLNIEDFEVSDYAKQIWNTPNVINNFNEVNIGFRSLMYMTGTLLIGHDSSPIVELIYNKGQTDEVLLHKYMITFTDSFDIYPDTQAFFVTNGIGRTAAKTAAYAFSITLFKVTNPFMNKIRTIKRGDLDGAPNGISTKFSISMRDKDEFERNETTGDIIIDPVTELPIKHYFTVEYTLINMTIQQNKGDLPTVSLTFSR